MTNNKGKNSAKDVHDRHSKLQVLRSWRWIQACFVELDPITERVMKISSAAASMWHYSKFWHIQWIPYLSSVLVFCFRRQLYGLCRVFVVCGKHSFGPNQDLARGHGFQVKWNDSGMHSAAGFESVDPECWIWLRGGLRFATVLLTWCENMSQWLQERSKSDLGESRFVRRQRSIICH